MVRSEAVVVTEELVANVNTQGMHKVRTRATRPTTAFTAAVLLLAAAALLALAPGRALAVSFAAGMMAPDFTVRTLRGDQVSLHDYHGKVVLVMFWSSWCSRCSEELEFLRTMAEKYPALEVLALNAETEKPTAEDVARIMAAAKSWKQPVAVAIDDGLKVWSLYQVNALPTSMIVGADGTILFIEANFYWASPELFDNALRAAFEDRSGEQAEAALTGQGPGARLESGQRNDILGTGGLQEPLCRKVLCQVVDIRRP